MTCRVTIWGARGSIPTPGPLTARYGGNTPCVTLLSEGPAGRSLVILDAGTGIRPLGRALVEASKEPLVADLLISHTHWDHIQGLPFFAPFYDERSHIRIWGAQQGEVPLEQILREQMNPVVFPVPLHQLDATLSVTQVEPGRFPVGEFVVDAMRLRHPGNTLAFRLVPRSGGPSVVYVTDNELGPGGTYEVGAGWRDELVGFAAGADLLIHDTQYTPEEYRTRIGFGHSNMVQAFEFAALADVKHLVPFHHDPAHSDNQLDQMITEATQAVAPGFDVTPGLEGAILNLEE